MSSKPSRSPTLSAQATDRHGRPPSIRQLTEMFPHSRQGPRRQRTSRPSSSPSSVDQPCPHITPALLVRDPQAPTTVKGPVPGARWRYLVQLGSTHNSRTWSGQTLHTTQAGERMSELTVEDCEVLTYGSGLKKASKDWRGERSTLREVRLLSGEHHLRYPYGPYE